MAKILLVEDNIELAQMVRDALRHYAVEVVYRADDAYEFLKTYVFDLIILDLNLPDGDGLDICLNFRTRDKSTPVLMLTARDKLPDKIEGLDSGADDYLTKPFEANELQARVRSLLRRKSEVVDRHQAGNISIDLVSHMVRVGDQTVSLAKREFELLSFFINHFNQEFDVEGLRVRVWGPLSDVSRNAVMTSISRLRSKLEEKESTVAIETDGGRYRLSSIDEP